MSNHPTLDRTSFQKLLASAFAVQESGMKPESLAAILELQRSIRTGHLDVDGAAHLIAEWARSVANASGVAIGRLKGDQLIYTAGSGSAASYIGRRIMATFNTSAPGEIPSEILRVNDTTTDGRIEAAVCRQFGVKSLLILPVHRGRFLAGVLQVLFNEAHSFQDQEVRTYWILGGLVGEAMLQAPSVQKRSATVAPPVTEEVTEHFPAPLREPANEVEAATVAHATPQTRTSPTLRVPRGLPRDWARLVNRVDLFRLNHFRVYKLPYDFYRHELPRYVRDRISGLVVASIVLVSTWILCTAPPAIVSSVAVPPMPSPNTTVQETPQSRARQATLPTTTTDALPGKLNYPAVRNAASVEQRHSTDSDSHVKHFGNDVTVRYFTPQVPTVKMTADSEVRHVSEDVTVRYFKSRNVSPSAEPVATSSSQTTSR